MATCTRCGVSISFLNRDLFTGRCPKCVGNAQATAFCTECATHSTDEGAGNLRTINGVGSQFYGWSARCPTCGSLVKTVWLVFGHFPLLPMASFRVLEIGNSKFLSRGVPLRRSHVFFTWLVAYFLAVVLIGTWASVDYKNIHLINFVSLTGSFVLPALIPTLFIGRMVDRLLGETLGCCFFVVCFIGLLVGAFCFLFGAAGFEQWPPVLHLASAILAPLILVIVPGTFFANWFHRKRVA
jgi:hypothetical protein